MAGPLVWPCVCVSCSVMTDKLKLMFTLQTPGVWVAQASMQMWKLISERVCVLVCFMYAGMFPFLMFTFWAAIKQYSWQINNFKSSKPFKAVVFIICVLYILFIWYCMQNSQHDLWNELLRNNIYKQTCMWSQNLNNKPK